MQQGDSLGVAPFCGERLPVLCENRISRWNTISTAVLFDNLEVPPDGVHKVLMDRFGYLRKLRPNGDHVLSPGESLALPPAGDHPIRRELAYLQQVQVTLLAGEFGPLELQEALTLSVSQIMEQAP